MSARQLETPDPAAQNPPARRVTLPIVSVIIPALNEEKHIEGCLEALIAQAAPRSSFEVILVDNGSTDQTIKRALAFTSLLDLTILQQPGVRISQLRNYGASHASGDILAFLDADCLPGPRWIADRELLLARLDRIGVLGAQYRIPPDSTWLARAWDRESKPGESEVRYVPASAMLMRRSVFEAVNGFDPALETNEDVELCGKVRTLGLPVVADDRLAVVHLGTTQTLRHFYKREHWHGTSVFKVFLRSPGTSGNEKVVLLAVCTLIFEIIALSGLFAGFAYSSWSLLMLGFALWLAPPLFLTVNRIGSTRKWRHAAALILLYATYATARAHSLVFISRARGTRSNGPPSQLFKAAAKDGP